MKNGKGKNLEDMILNPKFLQYMVEKDIYCVDIITQASAVKKALGSFEDVISKHKKYFQNYHILIDVLSVKMHPAKIFKKYFN